MLCIGYYVTKKTWIVHVSIHLTVNVMKTLIYAVIR